MPAPRKPIDDHARIEALRRYDILDSLPEKEYQEIVTFAANACDVPISLISFVDCDRQWFKAKVGLNANQTPRELAFCAYAILDQENVLIVPDATKDTRFADNDLVVNDPKIRFYAGAPIVTNDGHALGTLCIIDTKPREITEKQVAALKSLSRNIIDLMEIKHTSRLLEERNRCLEMAASISNLGHWWLRVKDSKLFWSDEVFKIHGLTKDQYAPDVKSAINFYHHEDRGRVQQCMHDAIAQKKPYNLEVRLVRNDGDIRCVIAKGDVQLDRRGEVEKVFGVFQDVTDRAIDKIA